MARGRGDGLEQLTVYTLYYSPGTASMCVHQALIETNAQYRLVLVDLKAGKQREPAYFKLNPGGVVPTLLIDEVPFTESAALMMTIATRHPAAGLAPTARARSCDPAAAQERPRQLNRCQGIDGDRRRQGV